MPDQLLLCQLTTLTVPQLVSCFSLLLTLVCELTRRLNTPGGLAASIGETTEDNGSGAHMPDQLLRCLFEHVTKSPHGLGEVENPQVKLWTSWARDLARGEVEYQKNWIPG